MVMIMIARRLLYPCLFLASAISLPAQAVWEATHSDLPGHRLLITGSIHFLPQDAYPLSNRVETAFEEADMVVFEADIDQLNSPRTMGRLMEEAMLGPDRFLHQVIPQDLYQRVREQAVQLGLPAEQFDIFSPWFVSVSFSVAELVRMGFNPEFGVDRYFHMKAKEAEKETGALETVDFQIELLTGMSMEEQAEFLKATLDELENLPEYLDQLLEAWKGGDEAEMDQILVSSFRENPEVFDRFLGDRNEDWIPKLREFLEENRTTLVVVGAAHLPGERGVLDLLREAGYEVEVRPEEEEPDVSPAEDSAESLRL